MRITFDESTGSQIAEAIRAAEWTTEINVDLKVHSLGELTESMRRAAREARIAAEAIKEAMRRWPITRQNGL